MPFIGDRASHVAWTWLARALSINSARAYHSITVSRRRIWRAVK